MSMTSAQKRLRAFALMPTLALMFIIAAMIAAALQQNLSQRAHLKSEKDLLDALYLAESGAQEALHRAAARPEAGSFARDVDHGSVATEWTPADGGFHIVSVGVGRRASPEATRRVVTVDVEMTTAGQGAAARIVNWRVE